MIGRNRLRSLEVCGIIEMLSECKASDCRMLKASSIDVTLKRVWMRKWNEEPNTDSGPVCSGCLFSKTVDSIGRSLDSILPSDCGERKMWRY